MRTPQGKYGCALADGTLLVCGATSMVDPVGSAAGFACVQRGVLLRLSASGELLSERIFPFSGGVDQPGRREGCMCVTPGEASDDEMVVYVTGYLRSECGYDPSTHEYDDDPMVSNIADTHTHTHTRLASPRLSFAALPRHLRSVPSPPSFWPPRLAASPKNEKHEKRT